MVFHSFKYGRDHSPEALRIGIGIRKGVSTFGNVGCTPRSIRVDTNRWD